MARMSRLVVPGMPHHVTQRGNRRQRVFFSDGDHLGYLTLLRRYCRRFGVQIWAYCLMDNHVHLVAVPERDTSLAQAVGDTHRRYTSIVNRREGWTGYLWQGRFASVVLDESHLYAAVRYVERNPVRAGLVARPEQYRWSSARAHVTGQADPVLSPCFLTERIPNWSGFLSEAHDDAGGSEIERHLRTGRPYVDDRTLDRLEAETGRRLRKQRPGRKAK